ncbi:MAG: tRNA guanosine(34) transglycosylase Tgt, partial [Candidatus Woesearchaeota archaeon]|nr:tRNA guanosine(34) transglycosylase Tgt [Candidatus Woesearchaeota archaeon]
HNFMGWQKPIMTDSGGFQIFSLGKQNNAKIKGNTITFKSPHDASLQELTPEKSIHIQETLGADIIFALDECIDFNSALDVVKDSTARTHIWAQESLSAHSRKDQLLYGIVQGGRFQELREYSSEFIGKLDFGGFGIGSLFGEPKEESKTVLKWAMSGLPKDKPVHMLGIGQVDDIFGAVEQGADTFDCVLATRLARMGYIFSSECTKNTKWRYRITNATFKLDKKPFDKNCDCWACTNHSRAYLHHLFKSNELLAYTLASYHNVAFFHSLMKQIREAIEENTLEQLRAKWLR